MTWSRTCGSGTAGCAPWASSTTTGTPTGSAGCTRCIGGPSCRRCGCAGSGGRSSWTRRPSWHARARRAPTGWARSSRPRTSGEGPRRRWCGRSGWERARSPCGWTWGGAWCACGTTTRAWWCRCPGTRRACGSAPSSRGASRAARFSTSCRCTSWATTGPIGSARRASTGTGARWRCRASRGTWPRAPRGPPSASCGRRSPTRAWTSRPTGRACSRTPSMRCRAWIWPTTPSSTRLMPVRCASFYPT